MPTANASLSGEFGTLRMTTDVIEVSAMSGPNKSWRYTDKAGHEHRYVEDNTISITAGVLHYPTLREVVDREWAYYCEDCGEEHEERDTHLECRQCGEHIRPGTVSPYTAYLPDLVEYYLDDEPISRERANEILAEYERQRRERDYQQKSATAARLLGWSV